MPFEGLPCWCLLQGLKPQCLGDWYPVVPGVPCASLRGFPPAAGLTAMGVHSASRPDPQCFLTQGSKVTWKGLAALDRAERGVGGHCFAQLPESCTATVLSTLLHRPAFRGRYAHYFLFVDTEAQGKVACSESPG